MLFGVYAKPALRFKNREQDNLKKKSKIATQFDGEHNRHFYFYPADRLRAVCGPLCRGFRFLSMVGSLKMIRE